MTLVDSCPICQSTIDKGKIKVNNEVLKFLHKLEKDRTLNEYLTIAKKYVDIMRQTAPTATVVTKAISTIKTEVRDITSYELEELASELPSIIKKSLLGQIPNTEELQVLSETLPQLLVTMQTILRKQEVPDIKGKIGEQELAEELSNYFPGDEVERLGKSGETDIILRPMIRGTFAGYEIMVESKNSTSWRRSYMDSIRQHMANRNCRYSILAVQKMPKGANGYLWESVSEGTIFVTSREQCKMVYGALRSIIQAEFTMERRAVNLEQALADIKIQEAIREAFMIVDHFEKIRKKVKSIITNSQGINTELDKAENVLRGSIAKLQNKIHAALNIVPEEEMQESIKAQAISS
jgi:hypothetical protein